VTHPIRLAISTCPNDTFAFHGLLSRAVDWRGLRFEVELLDIEALNERLLAGTVDVCKASYHAAVRVADRIVVLPVGTALGFGVGPLLLAATDGATPRSADQLTLLPGRHTTAALLYELFHPRSTRVEHDVFSRIMPRLAAHEADFGVCIHEGRFTWPAHGLFLVEDLGRRWEQETDSPLPLGGIMARQELPDDVLAAVCGVIGDSLALALADPDGALPTMRTHAQEFDDAVLMQHVDLYVNEWTVDLGERGRRAVDELSIRAARAGLTAGGRLRVFGA